MNYHWDPLLLIRLYLNKDTRDELYNLYHPSASIEPIMHAKYSDTKKMIMEDYRYTKRHPFLKEINDKVFDEYGITFYEDEIAEDITFNNDDLLFLTKEFYQNLDKDLYQTFSQIFDKRFINLRFVKPKKVELYEAQVIHSHLAKETFIELTNHHSFRSLLTTVHEFGHAISVNNNNGYEKAQMFTEIESIFPELVALDYFEKYPQFKENIDDYRANAFNEFLDDSLDLLNRFTIARAIDMLKDKYHSKKFTESFYQKLLKIISMNKEEADDTYAINIKVLMPYYIGYLGAFALYDVYQKDPEKAMYLYKKITDVLANIPIDKLYEDIIYNPKLEFLDLKLIENNGISLGENIDSFESKIRKRKMMGD